MGEKRENEHGLKKSPCVCVLNYDPIMLVGPIKHFAKVRLSTLLIRACFSLHSTLIKKEKKPHPGIVTVLRSITVTSPRCLNRAVFGK